MARANDKAVVWDRAPLLALCPADAVPYDAPEPVRRPAAPDFTGAGSRLRCRSGRPQRDERGGRADGRCGGGRRSGPATAALADFQGARRRLELLGSQRHGVPIFDDYAHHPTEVAATIAAGAHARPARLVALFQPHLYSRTRALAREFGARLAGADRAGVLRCTPPASARRIFPDIDGHLVAAAAAEASAAKAGSLAAGFEVARRFLADTLRAGDMFGRWAPGTSAPLARPLTSRPSGPSAGAGILLCSRWPTLPSGSSATIRWPVSDHDPDRRSAELLARPRSARSSSGFWRGQLRRTTR